MTTSGSEIQVPKYPCRSGHKHLTSSAASGCDALRWSERLRELGLPTEAQTQAVAPAEEWPQVTLDEAIEAERRRG